MEVLCVENVTEDAHYLKTRVKRVSAIKVFSIKRWWKMPQKNQNKVGDMCDDE